MKTAPAHFKRSIAANLTPQSLEVGRALRARRGGQPGARPAFRSQAAFTMIEIAIALGVIGFALVAIIGILPVGLNVQRESRQDTIIGQDGPFFLEAIRNGGSTLGNGTSTSLDFLTNYVESITILNVNGTIATNIYTNDVNSSLCLRNGQMILGLLTTPEFLGSATNYVTARIRGLTGAATEQNGSNAVTAFRYYMAVEIVPFNSISPGSTDFLDYTNNPAGFDYLTRFERAAEAPYLVNNLYELRLKFSWPIRPNGTPGQGRQTYRSLVSAHLLPYANSVTTNWFFQPNTYSTNLVL